MLSPCYISKDIEKCGQKALAFVPNFFRLQKSVIDGFEKNGIGIYLFLDKPRDNVFLKSRLRINPKFVSGQMTRYLKNKVFKYFNNREHPDCIVVFEGQAFLEKHVKMLKSYFSKSKLIIYCWDSIERFPYIENNLKHFDRKVTFSYDNLGKYHFDSFVPLFIPDEFFKTNYLEKEKQFDLCFIGTGHPPKIKFLSQIEAFCKEHKLSFVESLYLPSKSTYFYYKLFSKSFRKRKINEFVFKGKNAEEIQQYYSKARCVVDAGNPNESGISLRIYECLGMKKKVILATSSIRNYEFYSPDRFLIFPEEKERIFEFIHSPYPEINNEVLETLTTKNWIKCILGNN